MDRAYSLRGSNREVPEEIEHSICFKIWYPFNVAPVRGGNRANSLEVLDLLGELNRDGISVLMVTHDVRSAIRGNRVLYFEDGGIRGELELAPWDPALSGDEAYVREREAMASAWLASLSW